MRVYLFKPRFAELVKSGTKRQTIRPTRKDGRRTKPGDLLSLRTWQAKPYRSKQQILREAVCLEIHKLELIPRSTSDGMFVSCFLDGERLETVIGGFGEWDLLARADGFKDAGEMLKWFKEEHGLPFEGDLIRW